MVEKIIAVKENRINQKRHMDIFPNIIVATLVQMFLPTVDYKKLPTLHKV